MPTRFSPSRTTCCGSAPAGLRVTAWQTSYLHLLPGADPVLEWVRGTGLRPVLAALSEPPTPPTSSASYAERLRTAYPATELGTVFPFLRTFVVGAEVITGIDHVQVAIPAGAEDAARASSTAACSA